MSTGSGVSVFLSYARRDGAFRDEFLDHTSSLWDEPDVTLFYDPKIQPGEYFDERIRAELKKAAVFVGLVTARFRKSPFCYHTELGAALDRHEAGECRIFLVNVSPVHLSHSDRVRRLHHVPSGSAIDEHVGGERDRQWKNVAKALEKQINELRISSQRTCPDKVVSPDLSTTVADLAAWREGRGKDKSQAPTLVNPWMPLVDALTTTKFDAVSWQELAISTQRVREQLARPWPPHPLLPDRISTLVDQLTATLATGTSTASSRRGVQNACSRATLLKRRLLDILTRVDTEEP